MKQMQNNKLAPAGAAPSGPSLNIADIYYVLFKHKWKIVIPAVLGVMAAAYFYATTPPQYVSEAKLMVQYVQDTRAPGQEGPGNRPRPIAQDPAVIMSSEAEILTSTD